MLQLSMLAVLAENLGSVPSTYMLAGSVPSIHMVAGPIPSIHMVAQNPLLALVPGTQASLVSCRHQVQFMCDAHTYMQVEHSYT